MKTPKGRTAVASRDDLLRRGLLDPQQRPRYVLRSWSIQGQPIPDIIVRVSTRVTQVGADGVLGLDFLGRFTDIHFHVPTRVLTLTGP